MADTGASDKGTDTSGVELQLTDVTNGTLEDPNDPVSNSDIGDLMIALLLFLLPITNHHF
jgi:hypothetical protein